MKNIKIGFIGLGNVGSKLAGSLLRNGFNLTVNDINRERAQLLIDKGDVQTLTINEAGVIEDSGVERATVQSPAIVKT